LLFTVKEKWNTGIPSLADKKDEEVCGLQQLHCQEV
jgi:hypothetical protein